MTVRGMTRVTPLNTSRQLLRRRTGAASHDPETQWDGRTAGKPPPAAVRFLLDLSYATALRMLRPPAPASVLH
ncbi:hypothetical protein CUJ88_49720 (plasmid) [Paraburkholderia hospita]|nr:hypothetical protein CUJ88_49720 [Paraburkholderia hospita]